MKKSSTTYFAIGLVAVAIIAFLLNLPDKSDKEVESKPGVTTKQRPASNPSTGTNSAGGSFSPPLVNLAPLDLPATEAPEFETIDRNGDGVGEVEPFIQVYEQLETPAAKIDMLDFARTVEPLDSPKLNRLLIRLAGKDEDPEVREAARGTLLDYSALNGHASLEKFLAEEEEVFETEELKEVLENLSFPPLKDIRNRK